MCRSTFTLASADGVALFANRWLPEVTPEAVEATRFTAIHCALHDLTPLRSRGGLETARPSNKEWRMPIRTSGIVGAGTMVSDMAWISSSASQSA